MINLIYTLNENDFLQLNLYFAKKEGRLKRFIWKSWIIFMAIMTVFIAYLLFREDYYSVISLIILVVIISTFHARQMKNIFLKQHKKGMKYYESRFNREVSLSIDSHLNTTSIAGSNKFNLTEITSIVETQDHFFIKLKIEAIIIPKSKTEDFQSTRNELIKLAEAVRTEFVSDLNWKW